MSVQEVEMVVSEFTQEELSAFREWFLKFDWEMWDREIEQDLAEGRLDFLIQEAEDDFQNGRTIPL